MSSSLDEGIAALQAQLPLPGPAHRDVLEPEAVRRFAEAVGTTLRTDAAGHPVAPPTFLTRLIVADQPAWYAGIDRGSMLHAGERMALHRDLPVGAELEWHGTLASITSKPGRTGVLWFLESHYAFRFATDGAAAADVWRTRVVMRSF